MACQRRASREEREGQMEGLRKLHRSQLGMPKRSLSCPSDQFISRFNFWEPAAQLLGSILRLQPNNHVQARQGENRVMIEQDTYCYKVMPFGLKNVGATYQRLVNMMFKKQIGVTMKVYVDDIMVKGKQRLDHIRNLAETFNILRKYKMKLNPTKCTFGVSSGRFLRCLVTQRGIENYFDNFKV